MTKLQAYEQCLNSLKNLIKAEKDFMKKSEKAREIDFFKEPKRARQASLNTQEAAHARNYAIDTLHADLVDADLCDMKDNYNAREITAKEGWATYKYQPKIPKRFQGTKS